MGKFLSETCRKYLVQRIIRWDSDSEREEIFRKLCKNAIGFSGQLIIIFDHPKQNFEHIHVIHDCNKSGGKCRYSVMSGINIVRYPRSLDKQLDRNSSTYIYNLRAYARKDDRRVKYIRVKRSDGRLLRDHAYYPCICGYKPIDPEHTVLETCKTRDQIFSEGTFSRSGKPIDFSDDQGSNKQDSELANMYPNIQTIFKLEQFLNLHLYYYLLLSFRKYVMFTFI